MASARRLGLLVHSTIYKAIAVCCIFSLLGDHGTAATTIRVHNRGSDIIIVNVEYSRSALHGIVQYWERERLFCGDAWTVPLLGWQGLEAIEIWGTPAWDASLRPREGVTRFMLRIGGFLDFYDVSTLYGYNIPMYVVPSDSSCPSISCSGPNAAKCADGYYPGGPPFASKACIGTWTNYDVYLGCRNLDECCAPLQPRHGKTAGKVGVAGQLSTIVTRRTQTCASISAKSNKNHYVHEPNPTRVMSMNITQREPDLLIHEEL